MQDVQKARNQREWQAQWIQLGLLGATMLAPLVKRWNELRALERTRELREDFEEKLQSIRASSLWNRDSSARDTVPQTSLAVSGQRRVLRSSTLLWAVGVGVGITAAGITTYMLVKRRMHNLHDEAPLPLTFRRPDGEDQSAPAPAPSGLSQGSLPAGTIAEQGHTSNDSTGSNGFNESSLPDVDPGAAIVGNIRTMVYHLADDENLPAPDNRIYFSSEEEARLAGYRLHTHS